MAVPPNPTSSPAETAREAAETAREAAALLFQPSLKRANCRSAAAQNRTQACMVGARYLPPWPECGVTEGQVTYFGACGCGHVTSCYLKERQAWLMLVWHVKESQDAAEFVARVLA